MFLSGDINDKRNLQSDWTGAHFSQWFELLQSYLWKEPFWRKLPDELIDIFLWTIFSLAILLDQPKVFVASLSKSGRGWAAWIHPTRDTSLRCCLFCGISPCRNSKILIPSRDIDRQRNLQSVWPRAFWTINCEVQFS